MSNNGFSNVGATNQRKEKLPEYCHADNDGECTHPLCPQNKDWKPICPAPKLAEEG